MDKEKIIVYSVLIIVVLAMIIYTISVFNRSDDKKTNEFYVPDIVKSEDKTEYESRLAKANVNRNPKPKENSGNMEFKIYESDSTEADAFDSTIDEIRSMNEDPVQAKEAPKQTASPKPKPKTQTQTQHTPSLPVQQAQSTQPAQEHQPQQQAQQPEKPRGGFGIVKSGSQSEAQQPTSQNEIGESRFFSIMLEESIVIKNNTSVVFILLENVSIGGMTFNKNSYAFGKAKNSSSFFDIRIEQIQNTDGRIYNVTDKGLFVFDEKYSRGFPFEGKLNEAVKDGTLEGAGSIQTGTGTTGLVQTGAQVADRVISKVTRKSEPTVSLEKGYRVYIKKERE